MVFTDLNKDGISERVIGAGRGGGLRGRVVDADLAEELNFFAFDLDQRRIVILSWL
ncbi:hypothetical protein [Tuwongella immobilis]|uniref:Uncharacterized protein n=1 Tax=Tuwongella immobilis TaxID=692036 RepID=A0A6C2YHZ1_9BACT|nr:hypothetical protein [Tuwongella immobilis]VIP01036.1 unnamed protein product [Tuwongella immobilis]VTR97497.1 unnamed protein product [Tuwongella immobilis]